MMDGTSMQIEFLATNFTTKYFKLSTTGTLLLLILPYITSSGGKAGNCSRLQFNSCTSLYSTVKNAADPIRSLDQ